MNHYQKALLLTKYKDELDGKHQQIRTSETLVFLFYHKIMVLNEYKSSLKIIKLILYKPIK